MRVLLVLALWMLVLLLCWPLAILGLLFWPVLWLASIPFRIVGYVIGAALALLKAILFLPARLLS